MKKILFTLLILFSSIEINFGQSDLSINDSTGIKLTELPNEQLTKIVNLTLSNKENIEAITTGKLSFLNLTKLTLKNNNDISELEIKNILPSLETLIVKHSSINSITIHKNSIINLKNIELIGLYQLERIERFYNVPHLRNFTIDVALTTELLTGVMYLKNLKSLKISNTQDSYIPYNFRYLEQLETLIINECKIRKVPYFIFELKNLKTLEVKDSESYNLEIEIPDNNLSPIENITLSSQFTYVLGDLNSLSNLKKIHMINLFYSELVLDLHQIESIILEGSSIEYFDFEKSKLPRLQNLSLKSSFIQDYEGSFENFRNLKSLNLSDFKTLSLIETISGLRKLERLDLSETNVVSLDVLNKLKHLKFLNVSGCPKIFPKMIEDLQKSNPNLNITKPLNNK